MTKKNTTAQYVPSTQKAKDAIDLFLKVKEIIGAGAAIALWVLAIWLSYKLAPLNKDIELNRFAIKANESRIENIEDSLGNLQSSVGQIREDTSFIRGQLSK